MTREKINRVVGLLVIIAAWAPARGADTYWVGSDGDWWDTGNWSDGEPNETDEVYAFINNGGTAHVYQPATCGGLMLGAKNGESGHVVLHNGGIESHPGNVVIGGAGIGSVTLNGGLLFSMMQTFLGASPGGYGTMTLLGGAFCSTGWVHVGTGAISQQGGTVETMGVGIGYGAYTISGGSLWAEGLSVGTNGTFHVIGDASDITITDMDVSLGGMLTTEFAGGGISTIYCTEYTFLGGTWDIVNTGVPMGKYNVLIAEDGLFGSFDTINLPPGASCGIDGGTTLWVCIPEPATLGLFALGLLASRLSRDGSRPLGA
jgi:hypothetical protein